MADTTQPQAWADEVNERVWDEFLTRWRDEAKGDDPDAMRDQIAETVAAREVASLSGSEVLLYLEGLGAIIDPDATVRLLRDIARERMLTTLNDGLDYAEDQARNAYLDARVRP